jgi:ribonuclease E
VAGDAPNPEALKTVEGQDSADNSGNTTNAEQTGERRERRSRDRYGRDRRERSGEPGTDAPIGEAIALQDSAAELSEAPAQDRPQRSYFERATQATAVDSSAAPVVPPLAKAEATPVVDAPAPAVVAAAPATPAAAVTSAPLASGMPSVGSYALPTDALHQIANSCGLQWINSDADKVSAVQAAIAAEPQPVRVPRERPPKVVIDAGPLVLVETRKDLKEMNLPF